jgi:hypothetical protein
MIARTLVTSYNPRSEELICSHVLMLTTLRNYAGTQTARQGSATSILRRLIASASLCDDIFKRMGDDSCGAPDDRSQIHAGPAFAWL